MTAALTGPRRCQAPGCTNTPGVTITLRIYPADSWWWWLVSRVAFKRRRACSDHVAQLLDELQQEATP